MNLSSYNKLQEDIKLRQKLLNLGICSAVIGPTGPKGERGLPGPQGEIGPIGPTGPTATSSNESIFFTSLLDTDTSGEMELNDTWIIPDTTKYFKVLNTTEIEIQPGIYEIVFSGLISQADDTHGAVLYLKDEDGSAIKDLYFQILAGDTKQMYFSQDIIFRFENVTTLQVMANITGDIDTSNITITDVNLLLKKIHE